MWEKAFDASVLKNPKIIVSCPDKELVEELMDLFAEHDVKWSGIGETPDQYNSKWEDYEEETCYWIENSILTYAYKQYAMENANNRFRNHIKCTFYGLDSADVPEINEERFLALFEVGGE